MHLNLNFVKYRDSLVSAVSISAVPGKVIREKSRGEGSLIEQDTIENVS